MDLGEFQRCIMNGIDPLGEPEERQAAENMLDSSAGLNASERLHVYRNNITSTRVRALQAIYPVCVMILGMDCFKGMAQEYCWRAEDDCADLNAYGVSFPAFLSDHSQAPDFIELPYIGELAKLEWCWHAAYYTADDAPFDHDAFATAATDPEQLYFVLAGALTVMQTDYPVREIWQRHRAQEKVGSIPALEGCEYLCIHRQNLEPLVTPVNASIYRLLQFIQQGNSLAQLGGHLGEELPELLPRAIHNGWISGFTSNP